MPWGTKDAGRFSKLAGGSVKGSRMWKDVADSALASGDSESTAIKKASGVVKKRAKDVVVKGVKK
jgi:hypothetical protein